MVCRYTIVLKQQPRVRPTRTQYANMHSRRSIPIHTPFFFQRVGIHDAVACPVGSTINLQNCLSTTKTAPSVLSWGYRSFTTVLQHKLQKHTRRRSTKVVFPWSTWAIMATLRIRSWGKLEIRLLPNNTCHTVNTHRNQQWQTTETNSIRHRQETCISYSLRLIGVYVLVASEHAPRAFWWPRQGVQSCSASSHSSAPASETEFWANQVVQTLLHMTYFCQ